MNKPPSTHRQPYRNLIKAKFPLCFFKGKSKKQGFTLIELALVLVIASVIIGAIWAAAEQIWSDYRLSRASQQITRITQNIREYYNAQKSLPAAVTTAAMDGLNIFPFEMRRNSAAGPGGAIDHPFNNSLVGGSFLVVPETCPNAITPLTFTCFRIRMQGLEPSDCIKLIEAVPFSNADLGIVGVGTANGATLQNVSASILVTPVPVADATVQGWCNLAGATNEVDWDFKLRN